ncbi:hypothetical protein VitviT2T_013406 [Vitis vinifera]|uniref:Cytochrome c-type biogenesis protein n=2 Tax=Vitis vinifera TaxID=29760 RepID=A0ABY9CHI8_VITVI|nr:hypothetical protein VitviT2T_013406 [Vitis vinifera]
MKSEFNILDDQSKYPDISKMHSKTVKMENLEYENVKPARLLSSISCLVYNQLQPLSSVPSFFCERSILSLQQQPLIPTSNVCPLPNPRTFSEISHYLSLVFRWSVFAMESEEDARKRAQVVEERARNISHNVRCTECGSQSIEDSQADVAILLRKLIRDEVRSGKNDKEIYKKLQEDFGESVLYTPKFDMQTAALWLSPIIFGGVAVGIWAYNRHRQKTDVHIMALNLVRGVPLTPKERETILDLVTPPPPEGATPFSWWRKWRGQ